MKHLIQRTLIHLFLLSLVATPVDAQTGRKERHALETRSADELLVDKQKERSLIEEALPQTATARPEKKRRLLIFDMNVNYGGHKSIDYASYAFARMGEETGAFETVITRDTLVFSAGHLKEFDAVFFNNTVGNLFRDEILRQNLLDFVYGGGGLLGVHATSVAFTRWPGAHEDWPEFGMMLGARGANHRESDEHVFVRVEDPDHPVTRVFGGKDFDFRDEFFRYHDIYSRDLVRVLLSMDTVKTDMQQGRSFGRVTRPDSDYAVAWIRQYGRGRVFYSTIAHNPYVFWDPVMLGFYLDGIQYALGDIRASAIPSNKITAATKAREKLGWKYGIAAYTFKDNTLFETIDKTGDLGLSYVGGLNVQKVSEAIPKNFDYHLSDAELMEVRNKLVSSGMTMLTYYIFDIPGDEETIQQIFEFGKKMGIRTFISEPKPEDLDLIEHYCVKYNIKLAIHNHGTRLSPVYYDPRNIVQLTKDRSPLIGAACDFRHWVMAGVDPLKAIKTLGHRVITLQVHDMNERSPEAHDVPWGTGEIKLDRIFSYIQKKNIRPVMFGLEYSYNWNHSLPEIEQSIDYFNQLSIELTDESE